MIIETIGLSISLVGIFLVLKGIKVKKIQESNKKSWPHQKMALWLETFHGQGYHAQFFRTIYGESFIRKKLEGLHPWVYISMGLYMTSAKKT